MDGAREDARDLMSRDAEMESRARKMRVPYVDLSRIRIDKEVASLIPESMARRYQLVCIGKKERKITLAMADPLDVFAIDDVRLRTGFDVESVLSVVEDIEKALDYVYGEDSSWKEVVSMAEESGLELMKSETTEETEVVIDQPVIRLVNMIITQAIERNASDIHIEPFESELLVRYRIDGVLHEVMTTPRSLQPAVISRIKILAQLKLDEKRIPQDGRINMRVRDRELDLRVATLPTLHGESVVMRILDRKTVKVDLTRLGFIGQDMETFKQLFSHPHGILLVTGPTGSGKSTTLYATLNVLNRPDRKIVTIEDPIEYHMKGIVQVQAHPRVGLTFATGLRAFLRADPNVIMVGEIRDKETATVAVEAALTGHLVLSTLHTNDAVSSVTRLLDMGIEPFLISSTLIGAVAQRLVRIVCEGCREPQPLYRELAEIFEQYGIRRDEIMLMRGKGCPFCNMTGYKGRIGIFELMVMSDRLRETIIHHASSVELQDLAKKEGLKTLFEDGLRKVARGVTTYEEICRVTAE